MKKHVFQKKHVLKKTKSLYFGARAWLKLRSLFDKIGFGFGFDKIAGSSGSGAKKGSGSAALLQNDEWHWERRVERV